MNFSSWNSLKAPGRRNPALSPAHITVEFERTKRAKIFAHKLGSVSFSRSVNINEERQKVVDKEIGTLDLNGFKYKSIGHVYSEDIVIPKGASYSYEILAHGHPLGGTEHGGMESCSRSGLQCASGQGTNSLCNPGKCIIGTLERINDSKWKYISKNRYGTSNLPLVYYLPSSKSVKLRTIIRGNHVTYSATGTAQTIQITRPASVSSTILLPPKFYFSEDFIDSAIIRIDERLDNVARKPTVNIIGIEDRKAKFIQNVAISAYPGTSEGYLNDRLSTTASEEIRDALLNAFSYSDNELKIREYIAEDPEITDDEIASKLLISASKARALRQNLLDSEWAERCSSIIEEEFLYRFSRVYSGLDLISVVFDRVKVLFESIIQLTNSSLSAPLLKYDKELISRPVYSRLPGISEGYRSDPAFSDTETPSQWLTSGVDEFLSKKKDSIASFYADYLDPDSCNPVLLDWLAQHVGLFGTLWNTSWEEDVKRAFIRNAFGWWDRELKMVFPGVGEVLTPKGEALNKFPFTSSEWVGPTSPTAWDQNQLSWNNLMSWGGEQDNLLKVKLDEVASIKVEGSETVYVADAVKLRSFSSTTNKVSLIATDSVRADKSSWNGLIESKGSLLGAVFLASVLKLKSHSSLELEVIDYDRKIIKPKMGLRSAEINAPVLVPFKQDVIQVGGIEDAEIGNFTNQLVADVSRVSSVEQSKNVFFRVPYYYNRDGRSWDKVSYIASNWMPSNFNVRVQYAYLSADLWAVGDAFFEPQLRSDERLLEQPLLLAEDDSILTTEEGNPLIQES